MPSRVLSAILLVFLLGGAANAQDIGEILGGPEPDSDPAEEMPDKTIDTDSTPAGDDDIQRRLNGIYAELEELSGITVGVNSGVVTLGGTASSAGAAEKAINLADQVADVVEVVDNTSIDASLNRRLGTTLSRWELNLRATVAALPTFLVALVVFIVFWWLGRLLSGRRVWFARVTPNGFIAELVAGLSRIVVTLMGAVLALSLLDATSIIGTVLGAAGIVGLAVGFAVRDTVENYIASILLSLRQPFEARDLVLIEGIEGNVARLTSRATILVTLDGNQVRIPNAIVYKAIIINYTRDPKRRFEFTVGVDTDLALQPAQLLAANTIQQVPGVLADPPVLVLIDALGDSNVSLKILCWIDQRQNDHLKVRSESIRLVKRAFDDAGIVMPEPIYRLRVNAGAFGGVSKAAGMGGVDGAGDTRATVHEESLREINSSADEPALSADTSSDTASQTTLEEEIGRGDDQNLLDRSGPRE